MKQQKLHGTGGGLETKSLLVNISLLLKPAGYVENELA